MEYFTSRSFKLPKDQFEMEGSDWFNIWSKKYFPYYEILVGDILYWYESKSQKLLWKTQFVKIERFPYSDKQELINRFPNIQESKYFEEGPESGYYIGYNVKVLERMNIGKPPNFRFPQLGWLSVDKEISSIWFHKDEIEDTNTLDNIVDDTKSIREALLETNEKMKDVSPDRIVKLVQTTIRKDSNIVLKLKKSSNYKCQFPNCNAIIRKKSGENYIEVAHIKPVSKGGQSILGNLIVLCPNHHKEFDLGDLLIREQTTTKLNGQLNGKDFEIEITS